MHVSMCINVPLHLGLKVFVYFVVLDSSRL